MWRPAPRADHHHALQWSTWRHVGCTPLPSWSKSCRLWALAQPPAMADHLSDFEHYTPPLPKTVQNCSVRNSRGCHSRVTRLRSVIARRAWQDVALERSLESHDSSAQSMKSQPAYISDAQLERLASERGRSSAEAYVLLELREARSGGNHVSAFQADGFYTVRSTPDEPSARG